MKKARVVISTTVILTPGTYKVEEVSKEFAQSWVKKYNPTNYCVHPTVRILGIEPAKRRDACSYYDEAIVAKPLRRLDHIRDYTLEEIEKIGVRFFLITKKENCNGDSKK